MFTMKKISIYKEYACNCNSEIISMVRPSCLQMELYLSTLNPQLSVNNAVRIMIRLIHFAKVDVFTLVQFLQKDLDNLKDFLQSKYDHS